LFRLILRARFCDNVINADGDAGGIGDEVDEVDDGGGRGE
jgi:hypothetical protein